MSVLRRLAANRALFGHGIPFAWGFRRRATAQDRLRADTNCTMSFLMASKTTTALTQSRQWGRIEVFPSAVAAIAGHAAMRCYGKIGRASCREGGERRGLR